MKYGTVRMATDLTEPEETSYSKQSVLFEITDYSVVMQNTQVSKQFTNKFAAKLKDSNLVTVIIFVDLFKCESRFRC